MKIECSQGSSGVWSWRFKSDTGNNVIAEGTKTFASKADAQKAIAQFADSLGVKAKDVSYVPLVPEKEEEEE
jgi:uncharacterized protein YegP (UPF0339 family)